MSTVIYNGFFLDQEITTVLPFLKDAKKQLTPFVEKRVLDAQCWMIATLLLKALKNGSAAISQAELKPINCPPGTGKCIDYLFGRGDLLSWSKDLVEAHAEMAELPFARAMDYSFDCDISLEVILFPNGKKTYGITHGAKELCEEFLALPLVHRYFYWNNVDAPENISPQEWEMRGKVWDSLIPSFYPADDGFSHKLFQSLRYMFPRPSEKQVEAWFQEHRQELTDRRTNALLCAKFEKLNPLSDDEMPTLSYYADIGKKVERERKNGTTMAAEAAATAEAEIPVTWEGIKGIIFGKENR